QPGETILVHAGGSGIGTAAIKMAKAIGCTVITTVGDDAKAGKAKELGADHVINYRTERFEHEVRKLTRKKDVDVVFEHVGAETFNGSLLTLKRGGRLVTCGSTSGPSTTLNLMQLFQQQYRIFGSFGATMGNIADGLAAVAVFKLLGRTNPDHMANFAGKFMRTLGPWLPEHRVGRANLIAAFPEKSAAEIETILRGVWDNLGRVVAEFAHLDRLWDYHSARPGQPRRILDSDESERIIEKLRDDGKPALIFAAHLANWEIAAVAAHS